MSFREDSEALRARIEALERELADERRLRLAAEAQAESERERRRAEVQAERVGREKRAAWYLLGTLVALGAACGVAAAIGYDEMGRLHAAAKLGEVAAAKLARQHLLRLVAWVGEVVTLTACGVTIAMVLRRSVARSTVGMLTAVLAALVAAVQIASFQVDWDVRWAALVFVVAGATFFSAFRLRLAER